MKQYRYMVRIHPLIHLHGRWDNPAMGMCLNVTSIGIMKWIITALLMHLCPITVHPFTSEVGPTVQIPNSPSEVLKLFFTDDLLGYIVEESNR